MIFFKLQLLYACYSMDSVQYLRSFKFYDKTALFDYFSTVLCVFAVTYYFYIPLTLSTLLLFFLSIPLHYIFNIKTSTNVYLNSICA